MVGAHWVIKRAVSNCNRHLHKSPWILFVFASAWHKWKSLTEHIFIKDKKLS